MASYIEHLREVAQRGAEVRVVGPLVPHAGEAGAGERVVDDGQLHARHRIGAGPPGDTPACSGNPALRVQAASTGSPLASAANRRSRSRLPISTPTT